MEFYVPSQKNTLLKWSEHEMNGFMSMMMQLVVVEVVGVPNMDEWSYGYGTDLKSHRSSRSGKNYPLFPVRKMDIAHKKALFCVSGIVYVS